MKVPAAKERSNDPYLQLFLQIKRKREKNVSIEYIGNKHTGNSYQVPPPNHAHPNQEIQVIK